ncbi:hypothetical protein [Commensalibacter nepenthis]|uniref:Uncharacterized protein n=1 Tax=Commensalibacter nepenthis TaxID=3043872 RepID=A0ABT6Q5X1_9PROT|nr:hypothetical protein [Commensalibacter sp. TBRC 10068]MDI2111735.1 hypothetical protein [Commensalibacter sp. TBRC 10068]
MSDLYDRLKNKYSLHITHKDEYGLPVECLFNSKIEAKIYFIKEICDASLLDNDIEEQYKYLLELYENNDYTVSITTLKDYIKHYETYNDYRDSDYIRGEEWGYFPYYQNRESMIRDLFCVSYHLNENIAFSM